MSPPQGPRTTRRRRRRARQRASGLALAAAVVIGGTALSRDVALGSAGAPGGATTTTTITSAPVATSVAPTATSTAPAPTTTATMPPAPPTTVPPRATLEPGAEGPDVVALETRLAALRYVPGARDGVFDRDLEHALWAFLKSQDLPTASVVDEAVWTLLQRPRVIMPHDPAGPADRIEIDLARQLLVAYHGGRQVLISHISSGTLGVSETRVGTFDVDYTINGWQTVENGRVYKPLWFDGNIGVHGFSSVPDHPASHGCVRIPNTVADLLFPRYGPGDTVVVF